VNAIFLPAHVSSAGLDEALIGIKSLHNTAGLMFTMPHKVAAMRQVDALTPRAHRVGSINLMRREPDGSWTGDNVDGAGFIAGLRADGVVLEGKHAYVHGAGGVGENIAWSLAAEPIASLTIFDIDTVRAGQLAERVAAWRARGDLTTIARKGGVLTEEGGAAQHSAPAGLGLKASTVDDPRALPLARIAAGTPDWKNLGLAINASPVGLETTHPLPFAVDALPLSAVVADVIMEPARTELLKAAQARGLKPHHGRNMMNFGLPLAAAFFGLPSEHEWHGGAIQGR
jgi:shikimate dehydrogenase